MPLAYVLTGDGSSAVYVADNRCGDFCDRCGDCLKCYGDDPCGMDEGEHMWIVYADQVAEFHKNHPEATTEVP